MGLMVVVAGAVAIYKDGSERNDGGGRGAGGRGGAATAAGRRTDRWKGRFACPGKRLMVADGGSRRRYCHCRVADVGAVRCDYLCGRKGGKTV